MLATGPPLFWAEKKEGPTVGSRKGHDAGIRRRNGNLEPRGRDSRNARTSCRFSATPTPVQKENRDTQAVPPQSLERVRPALLASHPR
jgi:hypothetical protein